jgi:hypothetical protein
MFNNSRVTAFQPLRVSENMDKKDIAKWANLLSASSIKSPLHAPLPLIEENPLPKDIKPLQAIMSATGTLENRWRPYSKEELEIAAKNSWTDLSIDGEFNPETTTLEQLAKSVSENRPLTLTELILVLKCSFLTKCRSYSLKTDFEQLPNIEEQLNYCEMYSEPCICKNIKKN